MSLLIQEKENLIIKTLNWLFDVTFENYGTTIPEAKVLAVMNDKICTELHADISDLRQQQQSLYKRMVMEERKGFETQLMVYGMNLEKILVARCMYELLAPCRCKFHAYVETRKEDPLLKKIKLR